MDRIAIGAYGTDSKFGHAAYDKEGRTWPVDANAAAKLEADRIDRIRRKKNPPQKGDPQ